MSIGNRIAEARAALGITQLEVSRRVGCWPADISNYETGARMPTVVVLAKVADALGVSIDWLVRGDEPPAPTGDPEAA